MRLETRLTLCATVLVLAVLAVTPVRSQESKEKITLTVNADGSMEIEANLGVPLPPEIASVVADCAIDYIPSADESVIQGTADVSLAPHILEMLPVKSANASFNGTEAAATGTLGLELVPNEQFPIQGIWANLNSQIDPANQVTTIDVDGFYTVAWIHPWTRDNITDFILFLQSQLDSFVQGIVSGTEDTVKVTKLEFGPQPELFDTYAKSTFSATVLLAPTGPTSVPGLPGEMTVDADVLSMIMAELQERNLARIRAWQAEATFSSSVSKIQFSFRLHLTGDIDTSLNAMIDVYEELARSGAIKGFDTSLMPLFETVVSVKDGSFDVTTSQGKLQITISGIVLKPPVERTAAGFRISPDYIKAASSQLDETSEGLVMIVKGNGVNVEVSPEAPKPVSATSREVVWPDFNVNLLSYLEFTGAAVTSRTTSAATAPSGAESWLPLAAVAIAVIAIVVVAAVLLLRRKKRTALTPVPSAPPDRPIGSVACPQRAL